jgi:hypothetical protein
LYPAPNLGSYSLLWLGRTPRNYQQVPKFGEGGEPVAE